MAMAKKLKTLIVEDSIFFRQLLKETLLSRFPEMDIAEAASAEEASGRMETFTPDLIFMDVRLPGESGIDLAGKIRIQHPDIPIIILTSYDLPEYREAAKKCQAHHFLSKGETTKENILTLVQSILSEKNRQKNRDRSYS
jgi:DNA-binding NarL/FixJ family response regulator